MARGHYPKRIRTAPPDPADAERYLRIWRNAELYNHPERFPRLASAPLFGNQQPLALEIGCGTGEFLSEMAARNPQVNYLGVELLRKPLYRAVRAAATRGLPNLLFLQADIRLLYPLVPTDTLQAVYLHFPAPYTSAGERKHSILNANLLDQMQRALLPGARFSLITDNPTVFHDLVELARANPGYAVIPEEDCRLQIDASLKSHLHRLWEARGCPIVRCEFEKRPATRT